MEAAMTSKYDMNGEAIDILDENFEFIKPVKPYRLAGGVVIDRYRMPREDKYSESRVLMLTKAGDRFDMTGGKFGTHSVTEPAGPEQKARVSAHWNGYISASRGRNVKRSIQIKG